MSGSRTTRPVRGSRSPSLTSPSPLLAPMPCSARARAGQRGAPALARARLDCRFVGSGCGAAARGVVYEAPPAYYLRLQVTQAHNRGTIELPPWPRITLSLALRLLEALSSPSGDLVRLVDLLPHHVQEHVCLGGHIDKVSVNRGNIYLLRSRRMYTIRTCPRSPPKPSPTGFLGSDQSTIFKDCVLPRALPAR